MPIAARSNAAAAKPPSSQASSWRDSRPAVMSTVSAADLLPLNVIGMSGSTWRTDRPSVARNPAGARALRAASLQWPHPLQAHRTQDLDHSGHHGLRAPPGPVPSALLPVDRS